MADSCLCKLCLWVVLVTLSWSTTTALFFFELAGEDCFRNVRVLHPDAAIPAQLHVQQDGLDAGQAGSLKHFLVCHVVLPFDAKDGAQTPLVKLLK